MLLLVRPEHHDEFMEEVFLEMLNHLIVHDFQGFEWRQLLPIRAVRGQGVIDIGNRTDPSVDMDITAAEPLGIAQAVDPLMMLEDDNF